MSFIVIENNSEETEDLSNIHIVEVHIVNADDDSVDMDIDQDEEINEVSEKIDVMDENNEKVLLDNAHSVNEYICLTCGFKTNSKDEIKKHKLSVHNWCSLCFSSFGNQEKLNNHISNQHKSV